MTILLRHPWFAILLISGSALLRSAPPAADVVVSLSGTDSAPGSATAPVRTLERARDLIRQRLSSQDRDLVVLLRGGIYYREEPFRLGPSDSGRNGHRVIYRAWPGEHPRLVGGRRLSGWEPTDVPGRYQTSAAQDLVYHQLFEDGVRADFARHPNKGYLHVKRGVVMKDKDGNPRKTANGIVTSRKAFHFRKQDIPEEWTDWRGAQVFVWAGTDWFTSMQPVAEVDQKRSLITLEDNCLGPIVRRHSRRYYLKGVRGALDSPGEFWRDPDTGNLLYQPRQEPIAERTIVVPAVTRVIELKGASVERPVRRISFEGIDVAVSKFSDSFVETRGTHGNGPWNEPMNKEAAVYLEHAEDCSIVDAEIANAGYSGVAMVWSARGNRVEQCQIRDAGFHGILLSGYRAEFGPGMDVNRDHTISNNWIHHCGRLVGHGGGIFLHSSGHNRIAHNTVHNMPRYGLCIKGQHFLRRRTSPREIRNINPAEAVEHWTVTPENQWDFVHSGHNHVVRNDFFLCNEDSEDSGFISTWGPGKNNLLEGNVIHDSYRTLGGLGQAIYLDDESHYFTVRGNLIYNFFGGTNLRLVFMKGTHHLFEDNVIVGQHFGSVGFFAMSFRGSSVENIRFRQNVVAMLAPGIPVQFRINAPSLGITWNPDCLTECDRNLYDRPDTEDVIEVNGSLKDLAEWRREFGGRYAAHSVVADPQFADPAANDFRFRSTSPAMELGIPSIKISEAGVRASFPSRFREALAAARRIPPEVRARRAQHEGSSLPEALAEDFETFEEGDRPQITAARLYDSGDSQLEIVADPAGEGKCVRFADAKAASMYDPRMMFNTTQEAGTFELGFDLWIPHEQACPLQLGVRDYTNSADKEFLSALELMIQPEGTLSVNQEVAAALRPETWTRIQLRIPLGEKAQSGMLDLVVQPRGGKRVETQLPFADNTFQTLNRFIFYGGSQKQGHILLDNLTWQLN